MLLAFQTREPYKKEVMKKLYVLSSILLFVITVSKAQPGSLDPSFGTGGVVQTRIASGSRGYAMAIQGDGKLVVAGAATINNNSDFALARYNTNGTLDLTFNGSGTVTTPISAFEDLILSIAIQADGKIVAAGMTSSGQGVEIALARYHANGRLDSTLDSDGILTPNPGSRGIAYAVAVQPDGKIVIAGTNHPDSAGMMTARFNVNGTRDLTFGINGVNTSTRIGDQGRALALQSDGKIVVGGHIYADNNIGFGILRYTTNGNPDPTFNGNGVVTTNFNANGAYINDIKVLGDGKIIAAGFNYLGNSVNEFALARYNSNGSPDLSFDVDGRTTTRAVSANSIITSIDLQSDGKIVAGGYGGVPGLFNFILARYNADGSLDPAFGSNGVVNIPLSPQNDLIYSVRTQGSRIYAAGYGSNNIILAAFRQDAQALPLKLLSFVTTLNKNFVECKWNTTGEENTSYFVIQRSANGTAFSDLGSVYATGRLVSSEYVYTDYTSSALPYGTKVYYRLKMVDKDGSITYSGINSMQLRTKTITLSPNPAKGFVKLNGNGLTKAQIINSAGKMVAHFQLSGNNQLNIASLAAGQYMIRIFDQNNLMYTEKLIIK